MQFRGQRREQVEDLVVILVAAGRAAAATLLSGAASRAQADHRQLLRVLAALTPSGSDCPGRRCAGESEQGLAQAQVRRASRPGPGPGGALPRAGRLSQIQQDLHNCIYTDKD
eukprot:12560788-Heterocapsa_arctica.AAC.1